MKRLLTVFFVLACVLPLHAESPVDGKWEASFAIPNREPMRIMFDLKADGEDLTGTIIGWYGTPNPGPPAKIQNGRLLGNTITFSTMYQLPVMKLTVVQMWSWVKNLGVRPSLIAGTVTNDVITFIQHDYQGETKRFQSKKIR